MSVRSPRSWALVAIVAAAVAGGIAAAAVSCGVGNGESPAATTPATGSAAPASTLAPNTAPTTTTWCTLREAQEYVEGSIVWFPRLTTSTTEVRPFTDAELHAGLIGLFADLDLVTANVAAALDAAADVVAEEASWIAVADRMGIPIVPREVVTAAVDAAAEAMHRFDLYRGLPGRAASIATEATEDGLPGAAAAQAWAETVNAADRLILNANATIRVAYYEGSPAALLRLADTFRAHADALTGSHAIARALMEQGWSDRWQMC